MRLWQLGSVGYDKVDVASLSRHGIPVANQPGLTSARSLAEHALMLAMMVARSYQQLAANVEAGTLGGPIGRQLAGRSLLIIGLGASGRRARPRGRTRSGCGSRAVTRSGPNEAAPAAVRAGAAWRASTSSTTPSAEADVVSLHVPLSSETRGILDARRLRLMPRAAIVVNVSRGGLIDEPALADAVRDGHLFGAGLDVVDGEPAPADHPLRDVPGVIILPHVAGATDATSRRRARFAALNISRLAYGLEPALPGGPPATPGLTRTRTVSRPSVAARGAAARPSGSGHRTRAADEGRRVRRRR